MKKLTAACLIFCFYSLQVIAQKSTAIKTAVEYNWPQTLNSPQTTYLFIQWGNPYEIDNASGILKIKFDSAFVQRGYGYNYQLLVNGAKNLVFDQAFDSLAYIGITLTKNFKGNIYITSSYYKLDLSPYFLFSGSVKANKVAFVDAHVSDTLNFDAGADTVSITRSHFKELDFYGIDIAKRFTISKSSFKKITFYAIGLPDTVVLRDVDLTDTLDFVYGTRIKPVTLVLANTDINKLKIPIDRFDFVVDTGQTYERQAILYQTILKKFKDAGLTEKFEEQDKRFQELKLLHEDHWIINWLSKTWWDYGYDKGRVFYISFILFIFFFICNIIFFRELLTVYFPDKFIIKRAQKLRQTRNPVPFIAIVYQLPGTFLYTVYMFWGLKLDLKEIEIKGWWAIVLILCQYILGVICLAYLANYVISK